LDLSELQGLVWLEGLGTFKKFIHLIGSGIRKLQALDSFLVLINTQFVYAIGMQCSTNSEKMSTYRLLVGKSEGKRQLGSPNHSWVDNIKMDLGENGWGSMDWIDLAHDLDQWRTLLNTVMNFPVPSNAGKFLSSYTTGGLSRSAQLHVLSLLASVLKVC
jgi:hypothetical protein